MYSQCNKCIITNLHCTPFHTAIAIGCVEDAKDILEILETEDRINETNAYMLEDETVIEQIDIPNPIQFNVHPDANSSNKRRGGNRVSQKTPSGRNEHLADGRIADSQDGNSKKKDSSVVSLLEFVLNSPISYMPSMSHETALTCEYISQIQHQLSHEELQHLYKNDFPVTLSFYTKKSWDPLMFRSCLGLALGSGNVEMVRTLTQKGKCNVLQQDPNGNACVHGLIELCELEPHCAVKMYVTLCEILDKQQLETLLHLQNISGYNALDFAAESCQPEILQAIINTQDVYQHKVTTFGCKHFALYDVTKYESKTASVANSVLFKLTDMDESHVIRAKACGLLTSEPFSTWCELKFSSNKWPVYMFFGFWLIFAAQFYLSVFSRGFFAIAVAFLMIMAVLFVLIKIMFIKSDMKQMVRSYKQLVHEHKIPVTFMLAYRLFQMIFASGILIWVFSIGIGLYDMILAAQVVNSVTAVLSILFFLQLNPSIGHMLMVSQKMITDVTVFLLTIALLFCGFSMAFYNLQLDYFNKLGNTSNDNLTDSVVKPEAQNFPMVSYTTFLLMLGVVSLPDMFFSNFSLPGLTMTLFVILVIVVVIVQLNMIIAVMSARLDETVTHASKKSSCLRNLASSCMWNSD